MEKLYQLQDADGNNVGLIETGAPEKLVERLWKGIKASTMGLNDDSEEIDELVSRLHQNNYILAERVFVIEINAQKMRIETYGKWRIEVQGGGQIADTGDYSNSYYVLTNGDIELVTKDEIDNQEEIEEDIDEIVDTNIKCIDMLVKCLNQLDVKWEDQKLSDKEFELHLKQQEADKWKQIAEELHQIVMKLSVFASVDNMHNVMEKFTEMWNKDQLEKL